MKGKRSVRRWINDDATIARPEILLAAVGNPALSHSTTYPRSASLTSRRGSRPIPRFLTRNRKFESISLQQRVSHEPERRLGRREAPRPPFAFVTWCHSGFVSSASKRG